MRPIKFRAWDKAKQIMLPWEMLSIEASGIAVFSEEGNPIQVTTLELMQFTGLLDKNGKEIYEGDIVRSDDGSIAVAEWSDAIDTDRYWSIATGFSMYFEDMDVGGDHLYEVIGNIYQNPELLNEKESRLATKES